MFFHIVFKALYKLLDMFFLERESYGVGVAPEVFKEILAVLNTRIDVESRNRTGRTCEVAVFVKGQYYSWSIVQFCKP